MKKSTESLKKIYKQYAKPTEGDFSDVFDSFIHKDDVISASEVMIEGETSVEQAILLLQQNSLNAIVRKKSAAEFPNIGQINIVYIDEGDEAVYIWDADHTMYMCVGRNFHNINLISGGDSNE